MPPPTATAISFSRRISGICDVMEFLTGRMARSENDMQLTSKSDSAVNTIILRMDLIPRPGKGAIGWLLLIQPTHRYQSDVREH